MLIDPKFRQRILKSLRWLVPNAKNRFDDCRGNLEPGNYEGGYSPELQEAIDLLAFLDNPAVLTVKDQPVKGFTEQQCKDTGILIGLSELESSEFYAYYERQRSRGVLITNLRMSMVSWKNKRHLFDDAPVSPAARDSEGLTPRQRNIKETGR